MSTLRDSSMYLDELECPRRMVDELGFIHLVSDGSLQLRVTGLVQCDAYMYTVRLPLLHDTAI